jgi:hypothetical protein
LVEQGALPVEWGLDNSFPALQNLTLSFNPGLGGTLPAEWGSDNSSFKALTKLEINNCNVTGTLPAAWATTLPSLKDINVSSNALTGGSSAAREPAASLTKGLRAPSSPLCV